MNQNEREGQSAGRTTGASGTQAEQQQDRTIEGQESQPGKVWQESDQATAQGQGTGQSQYTGQGDTRVGGSDPGHGTSSQGNTGQGAIRGGFDETRGAEDQAEQVNEQMDESQWQGSRFSSGGSSGQG